ncbi:MAG: SUMF1/EgtB/PvdO family nonheme iron enzyme [Leptolyngbya sp. SIO1D8]|nr:SUMF1/EgtB/PvdO family nonheme iron enzyme [Leptolyngbya sp. SIO1D8]
MPDSSSPRIFLAHASEDKTAVIKLYDRLQQQGYQPWLDKKDLIPGQKWREEIPKAIRNSDIFIACLSQRSVAKQGYVQREFRMALNVCADKPPGTIYLIPLRLDDCQIPELRQEEYGINLADYHWLDYFESDGFEQLVRAIQHQFPKAQPELEQDFQVDLGSGIKLEMVFIPGGEFMMGSPDDEVDRFESEGPQHQVHVPAFYIGKYPVTQRQWEVVAQLAKVNIDLKHKPSHFQGDNRPVESVDWFEAAEFCQRLSQYTRHTYRLPSEAEWEYACRAGTKTPYAFGNHLSAAQANFYRHYSGTTKVGRFPANQFGLHDMHGNVYEWCIDHWHGNYAGAPNDTRAWLTGGDDEYFVIRGGSWFHSLWHCRSAYRFNNTPSSRFNYFGFRVVCVVPRT